MKKCFIGSTEKEINSRLSDHKSASKNGSTPFYNFMKENGRDNFINKILDKQKNMFGGTPFK